MANFVKVGRADDVAPGEKKVYELDGYEVLVVNVGGEYFAVEDVCTHDGGPLGEGNLDDCQIICPRHGARFDLRTGDALTLPAFEPIESYAVKIENGDLFIESY